MVANTSASWSIRINSTTGSVFTESDMICWFSAGIDEVRGKKINVG
jgi:hypothetical protein